MKSGLPVRAIRALRRPARPDDGVFADCARRHGLAPVAAWRIGRPPFGGPAAVLVHEPGDPERRARLRDELVGVALGALSLTPAEWAIWSAGVVGRQVSAERPGLPATPAEAEPEARRRRLRQAVGRHRDGFVPALVEGRALAPHAAAVRSILEREGSPRRFPPIPPRDASPVAWDAATLGVLHASLAGEVAVEPGAMERSEPSPLAGQDTVRALLDGPLLDLPRPLLDGLVGLYLAPGPWGARHGWRLVAVVGDEASLHGAAGARRQLRAHLGLAAKGSLAALPDLLRPLVATRRTWAGILRRRLFPDPLQRLSWQRHRLLLHGDDALGDGLEGPPWSPADLRVEAADLLSRTAALWRPGASARELGELAWGRWPAVLGLARGWDPAGLAGWPRELAGEGDAAVAALLSAPSTWGDLRCREPGPAAPLLREHGPALLRLQELTIEALSAS